MDETLESLDRVSQYLNPDKVNPAHHSERDKERKFAQTLKDQMEEEFEKRKRDRKKDAVILQQENMEEGAVDTAQNQAPEDDPRNLSDNKEVADNQIQEPGSEHIDLKA
ncbi:MAG: hypothetical protein PHU88_05070 [candidate division Zixibacteria bacterium]|nr:hypothetical protein [candidate division Zixibacteria bacterium]MDD5425259.1 hypothetical protein [candidate division Zixibacteria bacterium]